MQDLKFINKERYVPMGNMTMQKRKKVLYVYENVSPYQKMFK